MRRLFFPLILIAALFAGWKLGQPGAAPIPLFARAQAQLPPAAALAAPMPSLAPLIESVKGSVVNVEVRSRVVVPSLPDELGIDPFERFFGMPGRPVPGLPRGRRMPPPVRQGTGSGFIIDRDGKMLTNNHVVAGADAIRVRLDDGRTFDAEILGRDPLTDLALMRLKGNLGVLPYARLGDSDALRVGDWVVAIGNPFGLASSVSAGIVSAKARDIHAGPYDDFIQTDAAINPGNSGGPLFNLEGAVVGINTAIVGGGTGIGFAVPSSTTKAMLPQLERGRVSRGWLGLSIQDLTAELAKGLGVPVTEGAVVSEVRDDGPAKSAGLAPEDVVAAVDGEPVDSGKALSRRVGFKRAGATVILTVYRGPSKREVRVTLAERPDLEGVSVPEKSEPKGEDEGRIPKLGLRYEDYNPQVHGPAGRVRSGAVITEVTPGSVAERADLRAGMVVTEAGPRPVRSARDLSRALREARSGSTLVLRVEMDDGRILRAVPVP